MHSALQRWVAAAPGSPAQVSLDDGVVRFESCDPGTAADVGKDASEDAVALVSMRAFLGITFVRQKATPTWARCAADRLVREFPVSRLSDPQFGVTNPAEKKRALQVLGTCP